MKSTKNRVPLYMIRLSENWRFSHVRILAKLYCELSGIGENNINEIVRNFRISKDCIILPRRLKSDPFNLNAINSALAEFKNTGYDITLYEFDTD